MRTIHLPIEKRMELYNRALEIRKERGWGINRIARELDISEWTVRGWILGGKKPADRWIPHLVDLVPSEELAYLIGVYYSDGYVFKKYGIGLDANDRDFVEHFGRALFKVVGYASKIWQHDGKFRVRAFSKVLHDFLQKNLDDHKPYIEKFSSQFLQGVYDGDGGVYYTNKKGWINPLLYVAGTDFVLMEYVRDLLSRHFSIPPNIRVVKRNAPFADYCELRITKREYLRKFLKEVGFSIKRKQERLEKASVSSPRYWTAEEVQILREVYPSNPYWVVQRYLKNRNKHAILSKAYTMQISKSYDRGKFRAGDMGSRR